MQWRPTGCRLLGSWLLVLREFVNFQNISIPVIFEFSSFLFLRVPILPLPLGERGPSNDFPCCLLSRSACLLWDASENNVYHLRLTLTYVVITLSL